MKRVLIAAIVAVASMSLATTADAKKKARAPKNATAVSCPSGMENNACEYYKDGFKKGREDRSAHMSDAYERHAGEYDTQNEPAFRQGYEVGWNSGH